MIDLVDRLRAHPHPLCQEAAAEIERLRLKGRHQKCMRGHPLTPDNVHTDPKSGKRICKICRRARTRKQTQKRQEALRLYKEIKGDSHNAHE